MKCTPNQTDSGVTFPDRASKGKSQKRIERQLWIFDWFSEPNLKTVLFQLHSFNWLFDASLVSRFVFWCGTPGCVLIQPHNCACNMCIISIFVNFGSSGGLIITVHSSPYLSVLSPSGCTYNSYIIKNESFVAVANFMRILHSCVV